ncbi:uncharacterized protein LOC143280577 [Babylonia areolata]|uniref:uncharacterized protein LOC143280577 n=1 Tax=Babylonia areolata TaxID=304850 RepID=UPI003FD3FDA7
MLMLMLMVMQGVPGTEAYSAGTPDSACSSMMPGHGPSRKLFDNPFPIITASSATYSPLQQIFLVIEPMADAQIKGFFMQARPANDTDSDIRIGTFVPDEESKTACNSGAVTHRRAAERYSILIKWRAPPVPSGDIVFRATVVNTFSDYYTDIYSNRLTFQPPTTSTEAPTTEPLWEDVNYTDFLPEDTFPTPSPVPPPAEDAKTTRGPHQNGFPDLPANFTLPPGFPNVPANFTFPPGIPNVPESFTFPPGFPDLPDNFTFPPGFPEAFMPDSYKRRRTSVKTGQGETNKGAVTCGINGKVLSAVLLLSFLSF